MSISGSTPDSHSYLHELEQITATLSSDNYSAKIKIKNIFQKQSSELIGELMAHPEQAKCYREIGKRLKKADDKLFKQVQSSIASIPAIAKFLREGREAKLDRFTRLLHKSETGKSNVILPSILEDFHALQLPRDLNKIRSISNTDLKIHLLASLINRDSLSFRKLNLKKDEMMAIGPFVKALDWQTFMAPFGGKLPKVSLNPEPLCHAVKQNLPHMLDFLLALKPKVNLSDHNGNSPISYAVAHHNPEFVRALVAAGAAIPWDRPETAQALAQAGMAVDPQNPNSRIHTLAAFINLYQIPIRDLRLSNDELMDIGPHLKTIDWQALMDAFQGVLPDIKNPDIFNTSIKDNKRSVVKALIEMGTDVNASNSSFVTPIFNAIKNGKLDALKELLANGADVNYPNMVGNFPIFEAIKKGDPAILKELIAAGADINCRNLSNNPPIFTAIASGNLDMVRELVTGNADVNAQDSKGDPVIFEAIRRGNLDIVKVLIGAGADVNRPRSSDGNTPIFIALQLPNPSLSKQVLRVLVTAGSDVNHPNSHGLVPILFAMTRGKDDKIIETLIKAGADLIKTQEGVTLFELAEEFGYRALIPLMKKEGLDDQYAKNLERAKFLAHIWGLEGSAPIKGMHNKTYVTDLSGMLEFFAFKLFTRYTKRFFSSVHASNNGLSSHTIKFLKNTILGALDHTFPRISLAEIHRVMDAGKPCILSGGSSEHAIYSVIKGNQLSISNRGEGRRADATEVFELPEALKNSNLLEKLSKNYENTPAFYHMLDGLKLKKIRGYAHKNQKSDNCATANLKAALYVLFVECLGKEEGRKIYKEFTSFLRTETLKDYTQRYGNDNLVKRATRKALAKQARKSAEQVPRRPPTYADYIASTVSRIRLLNQLLEHLRYRSALLHKCPDGH